LRQEGRANAELEEHMRDIVGDEARLVETSEEDDVAGLRRVHEKARV